MSDESKEIRKSCIFKIIPMMNPDGVICGNYRTNLGGFDLNRQFKKKIDAQMFPEIKSLMDIISSVKQQFKHNLIAYIDFHGHSIK